MNSSDPRSGWGDGSSESDSHSTCSTVSDSTVVSPNDDTEDSFDEEMKQFEVIISEVFTPGNFYYQLKREQDKLERFLTVLEQFYSGCETLGYPHQLHDLMLPSSDIAVGQLVVAKWREDGQWYRARIQVNYYILLVITSIV